MSLANASMWLLIAPRAATASPPPSCTVRIAPMARRTPYRLQLATTPQQWAKGLMHVGHLAADGGMLFIFPRAERRTFWMKDTPLPLDLLFVAADCRIVGIVTHAVPGSEAALEVGAASQYVVELRAGSVARDGLAVGAQLQFRAAGSACPPTP